MHSDAYPTRHHNLTQPRSVLLTCPFYRALPLCVTVHALQRGVCKELARGGRNRERTTMAGSEQRCGCARITAGLLRPLRRTRLRPPWAPPAAGSAAACAPGCGRQTTSTPAQSWGHGGRRAGEQSRVTSGSLQSRNQLPGQPPCQRCQPLHPAATAPALRRQRLADGGGRAKGQAVQHLLAGGGAAASLIQLKLRAWQAGRGGKEGGGRLSSNERGNGNVPG